MKVVEVDEVQGMEVFPGVIGRIPLTSRNMMFWYIELKPGCSVPMHRHVHEQMGIFLKGKAELIAAGRKEVLEPCVVYFMESNEEHGVNNLGEESAVYLEVFHPPREDYLKKFGLIKS